MKKAQHQNVSFANYVKRMGIKIILSTEAESVQKVSRSYRQGFSIPEKSLVYSLCPNRLSSGHVVDLGFYRRYQSIHTQQNVALLV